MGEHDRPKHEPQLPEDDEGHLQRQAGDRPVPTPGHIGNLPDEAPGPGKPIIFPPHEPED
jgi:hypothetical protein